MRTSLPELVKLKKPWRGLLEQCLCNTRRTKRVVTSRAIQQVDEPSCGRVGSCATTGEQMGASESPKAKILDDDLP